MVSARGAFPQPEAKTQFLVRTCLFVTDDSPCRRTSVEM